MSEEVINLADLPFTEDNAERMWERLAKLKVWSYAYESIPALKELPSGGHDEECVAVEEWLISAIQSIRKKKSRRAIRGEIRALLGDLARQTLTPLPKVSEPSP